MSLAAPRKLPLRAETWILGAMGRIKLCKKKGITYGMIDEELGVEFLIMICDCCELMWSTVGDFDHCHKLLRVEVVVSVMIMFSVLRLLRGFWVNGSTAS